MWNHPYNFVISKVNFIIISMHLSSHTWLPKFGIDNSKSVIDKCIVQLLIGRKNIL